MRYLRSQSFRFPAFTIPVFMLCLFCAGFEPALLSQDPAETFEDFSQVVEIQIPVNVSTRAGVPVRDLTIDDFEVLDDGKRQEIADFEVIDLETITPGNSRKEVDKAVPSAARRHFLLLFDLSFSSPAALVKAREAARQFVRESLHPTDLAAVATHAVGSGVNLVITFTPDRVQLARAIDTLGSTRFLRQARTFDPLRFLVDPLGDSSTSATGSAADDVNQTLSGTRDGELNAYFQVLGKTMQRMERSFARGRVSEWARSMKELGRVLDSVKGRKHVVVLSEGFDGRLLFGRQPDADDREMQDDLVNIQFGNYALVDTDDMYGSTPLQNDFNEMLEEFRRADTVIQAVDISGLNSESAADRRVRNVSQTALFYIANETGGELYEDANNFGAQLDEVLSRSNVTYLLTIRPKGVEADGSYHKLKIKLAQDKGKRVSARSGYYAPRPYEELHPLEKDLLASDAIASASPIQDVAMDVLAAPFRATEEMAYVPVIVEVDGGSLLVGHDDDDLAVEFYAYVTNERGEMEDFFTQMVTLDISRGRAQLESTGVKYYGHLNLRAGDHLIRVLTRNATTGRTGVASVPVSIPEFDGGELALLPPFFLEDPGIWGVLVREQQENSYRPSVVYPFTVNGEPYIPAARPRLGGNELVDLCLVAYNLPPGDVEIESRIVGAGGESMNVGELAVVERTVTGIDGLDKLRATFRSGDLAAGSYQLEVAVSDSSKGVRETSSIPFLVPGRTSPSAETELRPF